MATNPTTIDLTVYFVGECLFVPDTPPTMYVLMPSVASMVHVAMLCVEPAYIPGAQGWTMVSMDRASLAIGDGASFSSDVPEGLADVGALANADLDRSTLEDDPQHLLDARVTLTSGAPGTQKADFKGACWSWPLPNRRPVLQRIAYSAPWRVSGLQSPSGTLELSFTPLDGGIAPPPVTLTPNSAGQVEVYVYHAPAADLPDSGAGKPSAPAVGTQAPHFSAYYTLFENPKEPIIPEYHGLSCDETEGGSPYTSLSAW